MRFFFIIMALLGFLSCSSAQKKEETNNVQEKEVSWNSDSTFTTVSGIVIPKVIKNNDEWENDLSEQEFYVLREKGTERAFTSELLKIDKEGVFTCAACGFPLFETKTKFNSGTGWPSFYEPIEEAFIHRDVDYILGYARTEVMCNRCEGHLGHVFDDYPTPTGLRYCINGVSLDFKEGVKADKLLEEINQKEKN